MEKIYGTSAPFIIRGSMDDEDGTGWKIIRDIEKPRSLKIIFMIRIQLTADNIGKVYPDKEKLEARLWQNQGGMSWLCIAFGENAVATLRNLCGEHPNPLRCSKHTIRYKYRKYRVQLLDKAELYQIIYNAMHAPKNDPEAKALLEIIKKLIPEIFK